MRHVICIDIQMLYSLGEGSGLRDMASSRRLRCHCGEANETEKRFDRGAHCGTAHIHIWHNAGRPTPHHHALPCLSTGTTRK